MSVSAIIAFNQWLKWMYQCADDVLMVSREECVVKYTLARTDAFLEWSGLEIMSSVYSSNKTHTGIFSS